MEQLPQIIDESWHPLIKDLFQHESMKLLKYKILRAETSYPERKDIFKVFRMRVQDVRIIVLGQDPYARKGQATGLAFAVNENMATPPSLRVIKEDNNIRDVDSVLFDHTLEHWERQGVFLLNTALTVRQNDPGSHIKHWRYFTEGVLKALSKHKNCIYLLWGEKAKAFEPFIENATVIPYKGYINDTNIKTQNVILEAGHPASELYSGSKGGFYKSYHFTKVNQILLNSGIMTPITWQ